MPSCMAHCKTEGSDLDKNQTECDVNATLPKPDLKMIASDIRAQKLLIIKDLLVLSVGFLCNFLAYYGLVNLQSSLNDEDGLGATSVGVSGAAAILASLFVPSLVFRLLGYKWTIVACIPFYALCSAANFRATWWTLLPAAVVQGIADAPLWSAKCTYINLLSHRYAKISKESFEVINARFYSVFFMICQFDGIIGNLVSSLLLPVADGGSTWTSESLCGYRHCDAHLSANRSSTAQFWNVTSATSVAKTFQPNSTGEDDLANRKNVLIGVYVGTALIGCMLIAIFLSPMERACADVTSGMSVCQSARAVCRQICRPYQLLLIPITFFSGLTYSHMASGFTKAYVDCVYGIQLIGYVMMCGSIATAAASPIFGFLRKYTHRSVIYSGGIALAVSAYVAMSIWQPEPDQLVIFYLISVVMGTVDAVFLSTFYPIYGEIFVDNTEVAYISYLMWENLGYTVGFFWSPILCTYVKQFFLIALAVVGIICYYVMEIRLTRTRNQVSVACTRAQEISNDFSVIKIDQLTFVESLKEL